MFCLKCGNKLKEESKFCTICGTKQVHLNNELNNNVANVRKRITIGIIIVLSMCY